MRISKQPKLEEKEENVHATDQGILEGCRRLQFLVHLNHLPFNHSGRLGGYVGAYMNNIHCHFL